MPVFFIEPRFGVIFLYFQIMLLCLRVAGEGWKFYLLMIICVQRSFWLYCFIILQQVYEKYPSFDLTDRKDFIKCTVREVSGNICVPVIFPSWDEAMWLTGCYCVKIIAPNNFVLLFFWCRIWFGVLRGVTQVSDFKLNFTASVTWIWFMLLISAKQ